MRRALASRIQAVALAGGAALALAAAGAGSGLAGSSSQAFSIAYDNHLCTFPFTIVVKASGTPTDLVGFEFTGPATVTLKNAKTGRTAVLHQTGTYAVNPKSQSVSFSGERLWFRPEGAPFLVTTGKGTLNAPNFVLDASHLTTKVIDPCVLLGPTQPVSTTSTAVAPPWRLPNDSLTHIAHAGLIPVVGNLVRHDHVHLDIRVNGRPITIPAGVGMAAPGDDGPCPPSGANTVGDCASGHVWFAKVATAPIHTHSSAGLIHIESDRKGSFTLGQFFDEWGVRLTATCLGPYCTGSGKQLRVYVDGKRFSGSPRNVVLTNHQEVALVFGGASAFRSVPSTYTGGWPGVGCGGKGETSCLLPVKG